MRQVLRQRADPRSIAGAVRFLDAAAGASRRVGHDYIGTEHLLLALAEDDGSPVAELLARRGLPADRIRAEILSLVGPCDTPPAPLDPEALATLGIDLEEIRRRAEDAYGPHALERGWAASAPLAPRLRRAFAVAAAQAGAAPLSAGHLLRAIASIDCVAARILARNGVSAADVGAG